VATSQGDDHLHHPTRRRLLRDLTGAGIGVAGVGLVGREVLGQGGSAEVADAATPSCTLSPEVTEGPYYLDLDRIRRDITEGTAGLLPSWTACCAARPYRPSS
jgi:hypothetical protein